MKVNFSRKKKKLIKNNINSLRKKTNCRPSSLHSRMATSDDRKYVWGSQTTILESFKFEDKMRTSMRLNLKVLLVFPKKTPRKASFYFFTPKKLVRLFKLKDVKPSPDSKTIQLLTFDNLFPPL